MALCLIGRKLHIFFLITLCLYAICLFLINNGTMNIRRLRHMLWQHTYYKLETGGFTDHVLRFIQVLNYFVYFIVFTCHSLLSVCSIFLSCETVYF